ncbi:MAG TPA: GatB/YqeY domain-containing protein [Candidatus Paceibacterota bacterium]
MPLFQKINDDMKAAMKSGDKTRLEVLRFTLASLNPAQKEKTLKDPQATLSDEEVITILQKEAKKRKDSIELFKQGKRDDLVAKEEGDLKVLFEYLPAELSHDEIVAMVKAAKENGANDFSSIMKEVMKLAKGRADGKAVGDVIRDVERA